MNSSRKYNIRVYKKTLPIHGGTPEPSSSNSLFAGIFLAALLLAVLAVSCSEKSRYEEVRLSIEPDSADFGAIQASDPIAFHEASLTIRNLGKKTLEITEIELPEGFSYSMIPMGKLEEGDNALLKITMDIRKFSGTVSETAYVMSNDPSQPRMQIGLSAEIIGERTGGEVFQVGDEPDIEFGHKVIDFGTIDRHQTLVHNFEFENAGKKPLKIISIESFCKCVSGKPSSPIVQPGESSAIVAKLEAYKWRGKVFRKSLLIATNDPDEPSITLTVIAYITDAVTLEPGEILFPNIAPGQSATAEAKLILKGEGKLSIKNIETSSPGISVTQKKLEGGERGYLLTITTASDMPEGKFDELVTIYTNYRSAPTKEGQKSPGTKPYEEYTGISFPVRGAVTGEISATPQTINFGVAKAGESMSRKLFLSCASSSFEIISLSMSDPRLRASYSPAGPAQKFEITIEFTPGPGEKQIKDNLIMTTSKTNITVPVFAAIE